MRNYQQENTRILGEYRFFLFIFLIALMLVISAYALIVVKLVTFFDHGVKPMTVFMATAAMIFLLMMFCMLMRISSLKNGGSALIKQLGAVEIYSDNPLLQYQRLYNVVAEIALSSDVPMPRVYVINESGINAMAIGLTIEKASIAVTSGALTYLNRDELQGVIAHEFSHIKNGDMWLNTRMLAILGCLEGIVDTFKSCIKTENDDAMDNVAEGMIFARTAPEFSGILIPFLLIGYIGVFASHLLKSLINCNRETLADVSAVRFTRYSEGIAGALKKVAALQSGSTLQNHASDKVCHLLFGDSNDKWRLLATHPPIMQRIKALDPGFTFADLAKLKRLYAENPPDGLAEDKKNNKVAAVIAVSSSIKRKTIIDTIPIPLKNAASERSSFIPLMFALQSSNREGIRSKQAAIIAKYYNDTISASADDYYSAVANENLLMVLPLALICLNNLTSLNKPDLELITVVMNELIVIDNGICVQQYCVNAIFNFKLNEINAASNGEQPVTLQEIPEIINKLISAFAGIDPSLNAQQLYQAAVKALLPTHNLEYQPLSSWHNSLNDVFIKLKSLSANEKQQLVEVLITSVFSDNDITPDEAALLRTVCIAMSYPVPPMLDNSNTD